MKTPFIVALTVLVAMQVGAQNINAEKRLKGIDATVNKILKDWNIPGCGIGVVVKDKLVFAKGYGYRNIEKKQPVTPNTLFQIASNTKLFTATAIGFVVEEGKLDWDKPVKQYVPQIEFYNGELNASVTIRDMLSHRTGLSRHDLIWYNSDFTREELFDRIKYLEPSVPLRQGYLYNNLMYAASGQIIEYLEGKTWEQFVTEKIFVPLEMKESIFVVEEMQQKPDFVTPYYEERDGTKLLPYPFYTRQKGIGPAGSIISSINNLSHWLIAQINGGQYKGKKVISPSIIKETMQPASLPGSVPTKYFENLNSIYGMGRGSSAYKGHYKVQHGGAIGGIYSAVSIMPADSIGVIVFTNGAHAGQVPAIISNIVYDQLLALPATPWSERSLEPYLKGKETSKKARANPTTDRVLNTKPSHSLADYAGTYEDQAYGVMTITHSNDQLTFDFHHMSLPLEHYHYDRFASADDPVIGAWTLNFTTDPQGNISQVAVSLDQKEVVFTRKAESKLDYNKLVGKYELNNNTLEISIKEKELVLHTSPPQHLEPYKDYQFRIREFSDRLVEFVVDKSENITGCKIIFDGQTVEYTKLK